MRRILLPRLIIPQKGIGDANAVASAIITQEGTCPSPSNCSNNNPGNLVYAGQPGATPGPNGFAVFDSYADGYNALLNQLNLYANGTCGMCAGQPQTISGTFSIYAPAGQGSNNPTVYAQNVAAALGVSPDTSLASVLAGGGSPAPSIDLASMGLPDLSSIDPTTLVIGALVLGFVALMVVRA
jgi:hypothetical protein